MGVCLVRSLQPPDILWIHLRVYNSIANTSKWVLFLPPSDVYVISFLYPFYTLINSKKKKRICLQCRRPGLDPWVGKIPWRREWQPTPVFLPGEFHEQRNLVGQSPCGHRVKHNWATNTKYNLDISRRFQHPVFICMNSINPNTPKYDPLIVKCKIW